MQSNQVIMVTEADFRPTQLASITHHFCCKVCRNVVYNPKQCGNIACQSLFCKNCLVNEHQQRCPKCLQLQVPQELNKKLKNFMDLLQLVCPGCQESFNYNRLFDHLAKCEGARMIKLEGRKKYFERRSAEEGKDSGNAEESQEANQQAQLARRQTIQNKIQDAGQVATQGDQLSQNPAQASSAYNVNAIPVDIYVFQKDSRTVSIYNVASKTLTHKFVEFKGNFPHNHQIIQVNVQVPRVFMIGGGDYKTMPESMFQCRELIGKTDSTTFNLQFVDKKQLKYARHGHSVCTILDRYLIVSGSRKDHNMASQRVELYDTQIDEWLELGMIQDGRHYHSSCHFNHKFVYVFGGIQNFNKKYSNSIERLRFDINNLSANSWEKVDFSKSDIITQISARQGAGMIQISQDEIMVMGGFNGRFLNDYFLVKYNKDTGKPEQVKKHETSTPQTGSFTLFPFQVPTLSDLRSQTLFTVDWQNFALYKFEKGVWTYQVHVRNGQV